MRSICLFLLLAIALVGGHARAQAVAAGGAPLSATFAGLQNGQAVVKPFGVGRNASLAIRDGTVFDIIKRARAGDRLDLVVDDAQAPTIIRSVVTVHRPRDGLSVLGYMIAAAFLLLVFGMLACWFNVRPLIVGADNRYSNSKFQMAAWFFILFTVYLAAILMLLADGWLEYLGKIAIPQNLVILSGLSALTYGAAKAITVTKIEDAKADLTVADGPPADVPTLARQKAANEVIALKVRGAGKPRLRDLVRDDEGCLDLGDFQALFITVLALVVYLISGYAFLKQLPVGADITLPDVDTALLSVFGLGQGAYLAKKAVSPAGKG